MLNYIRSELYRTFRRKYTFLMIGIPALLCIAANLMIFAMLHTGGTIHSTAESPVNGDFMLNMLTPTIIFLVYFGVFLVVDCVFSDEHKNQTLKNVVSFGYTRTQIYFGKLITQLLLALLTMVIVFATFALSAFLLLGIGSLTETLQWYGYQLLHAFPIWLAGLAIANMLYFTVKGSLVVPVYLGLVLFLPFLVLNQMAARLWPWFQKLLPYLMFNMLDGSNASGPEGLLWPWVIGLGWTVLATAFGVILFRRREIK
ncbi:MAG: ABC transporter permease [Clostridiales bacterium]|jgi:ABC-2 type transport system permease protein|nr:ABC transporter permease [Clostridiales bacterium]